MAKKMKGGENFMDQNLGIGAETVAQDTPTHPSIKLLEAMEDSHARREVVMPEDQTLKVSVEIDLASTGEGNGTINGYTREHQIALGRMLEKDAWRS